MKCSGVQGIYNIIIYQYDRPVAPKNLMIFDDETLMIRKVGRDGPDLLQLTKRPW